ncbi:hypothetical protein EV356DRAFT_571979 [Viridothelium virens]|uniref:Uncharacterized protein n=1 Tax=Viridothelium virens TaxID=1048519 RepID=A0A6A6HQU5_VIRVR|nr:hypothetical protein EV356DRAFT_571979 [Viridothelium virens]
MYKQLESMPISITELAVEHTRALERAVWNIFSTELAVETYAQIVDGRPISHVYDDYCTSRRTDINGSEPSLEAKQVVEAFQAKSNPRLLQIDSKLAQAFQSTSIGEREFNVRLLEILAVLCHEIATILSINAEGELRQLPEESPFLPQPTELYHLFYTSSERYPQGVADIVGYWAEYRLFGGVVLFDRGELGVEARDVFIHPVGHYKIYQLSDAQIQRWAVSVLSENLQPKEIHDGLRFRSEKYARRIDPYDALSLNIYRDKYAAKIPEQRPRRCVMRLEDDPEMMDAIEELNQSRPSIADLPITPPPLLPGESDDH